MTRAQFELNKNIVMAQLNIIDVARWIGMDVRGTRAPCPFHNESSVGAFQFVSAKGFCHCHSCHESADIIGLVGKVKGLKPAEAMRELNSAFGLGLDLDAKVATEKGKQVQQQYEKVLAHKRLLVAEQNALKNILAELQKWVVTYYPHCESEEWDKRYIFALKVREVVAVYLDGVNMDNAPVDTVEQIKKWQQNLRTLDPKSVERERVNANILGYYNDFTNGKIMFEALIREQEKAVREYERL